MSKYDYVLKQAEASGAMGRTDSVNVMERHDAQDTLVFGRELETVEAKLYEFKYPDIKFREFFPVSYPGNNTDEFITWTQVNTQGEPVKQITNYAADFPMTSATGEQITTRVQGFGSAYGYSIQDMRVAARTGRPLDTMLASMARKMHEIKMEKCAFNGDNVSGFSGFVAQAGSTSVAPAAAAAPNGTAWSGASGKTAEEIRRDLTNLALSIRGTSQGIYNMATDILVPLATHTYLSTTPYVTNGFSDKSILQWVEAALPGVRINYWLPLTGTALAYVKSPDVLDFAITQEVEVMPPQLQNLMFKMPLWCRFAGARVRQPFAVTTLTGI
jgi:hypothetical protein